MTSINSLFNPTNIAGDTNVFDNATCLSTEAGELMSATGAVFYLNTPYDLDAIGNVEQTDSRSLESVTVDGE